MNPRSVRRQLVAAGLNISEKEVSKWLRSITARNPIDRLIDATLGLKALKANVDLRVRK